MSQKPWDQMEGESDKAYLAFLLWRDCCMNGDDLSTFHLVLRDNGIDFTESTIKTIRPRYKWRDRFRVYRQWINRKTETRVARAAAKTKSIVALKRCEMSLSAIAYASRYFKELPESCVDSTLSRTIANISNAMDAIRKAVETIGLAYLDADALGRELSDRSRNGRPKFERSAISEPTPEELFALSQKSGPVQPACSEAQGTVVTPDRNLPGDDRSESSGDTLPGG